MLWHSVVATEVLGIVKRRPLGSLRSRGIRIDTSPVRRFTPSMHLPLGRAVYDIPIMDRSLVLSCTLDHLDGPTDSLSSATLHVNRQTPRDDCRCWTIHIHCLYLSRQWRAYSSLISPRGPTSFASPPPSTLQPSFWTAKMTRRSTSLRTLLPMISSASLEGDQRSISTLFRKGRPPLLSHVRILRPLLMPTPLEILMVNGRRTISESKEMVLLGLSCKWSEVTRLVDNLDIQMPAE